MTMEEILISQDNYVFMNFILPLYLVMPKKGTIRIVQKHIYILTCVRYYKEKEKKSKHDYR